MKKSCLKCGKPLHTGKVYCSIVCRGHTGFRPGGQYRISESSYEEKLDRLKISYEKNVIRTEGCWDWKGPINKGGYTIMTCRKQNGAETGHRASWLIHKGEIPKFKHICHSCDNRRCTNPDHLWIGTNKQNNDDKIKKGREAKNTPPHKIGSENGASKLKEDQVKEIKELLKKGLTMVEIGRQYNVSKTTILRIKNKTHWKHIEEPC